MSKIVYLSKSMLPSKMANSVHVMKMASAFSREGHDVTLIGKTECGSDLFDFYGMDRIFSVKIFKNSNILLKRLNVLFFHFKSLFHVFLKRPDYIYGRNVAVCSTLMLLGFKGGIELHAPLSKLNMLDYLLLRLLLLFKKNVNIFVISEALKKIVVDEINVNNEFVCVSHDGSDPVNSLVKEGVVLHGDNTINVGYIGHLYKGRGVELLLNLAMKNPKIGFHFIGGNNEDIKYWKETASLGNIYFYGFIKNGDLDSYRDRFDALLAPYEKVVTIEGKGDTCSYMSPLKIFEYMSSGKPILCSDLSVLREVLSEKTAVLLPPEDIDAWDAAIKNLSESGGEYRERGLKAQDVFIKHYTWQVRAKNIFERLG